MDPLILAIGLYFIAILLAIIDVFVPSGGILLILSGIVALASVISSFRAGVTSGLVISTIVTATIPILVYSMIKIWPQTPIGRRVLLSPPESSPNLPQDRLREWVGSVIDCQWALAPMGQVRIGKNRYNAMSSDGRVIEPGQRVKVTDIHEGILVVVPTSEPLSESAGGMVMGSVGDGRDVNSEQSLLDIPAKQLGLDDLEELPLDDESPNS